MSHEIELYIVVALLCAMVGVAVTFVNKWHVERTKRLALLADLQAIRPSLEAIQAFTHAGLLPALESQAATLSTQLDWRGIPSSVLREDMEQRYQDGDYAKAGVRLMMLMVRGAQ